jgi:hypothetical protein
VTLSRVLVSLSRGSADELPGSERPLTAGDGEMAALIRELESRKFREREEASRALEAAGDDALNALRQASEQSSDPDGLCSSAHRRWTAAGQSNGARGVPSTYAPKPSSPARSGPTHEWHLLLGIAFRHPAFHLGPGLGRPVVVVPPPLLQARLAPARAAPHPVGGDRRRPPVQSRRQPHPGLTIGETHRVPAATLAGRGRVLRRGRPRRPLGFLVAPPPAAPPVRGRGT